ncbi:MAG: hypothetical protein D6725_07865 [Planctomycetota bacterium]|nr:MAG: hypothetical protein D6725_07865 [Planctomycetota bacterium]
MPFGGRTSGLTARPIACIDAAASHFSQRTADRSDGPKHAATAQRNRRRWDMNRNNEGRTDG